jgi:hypothetical protein
MTHLVPLNKNQAELEVLQDFLALSKRIDKDKPDPIQLNELRRMLVDHPHLWQAAGDLAFTAALRLITNLKTEVAITESLREGWHALRHDLGYATASVLERLMIDQLFLCWLQLNLTQCFYAGLEVDRTPLSVLNYWEKRLSAAQSRYLKACQALTRLNAVRVKVPVQLNIATPGSQQLNMINPIPTFEAQPVEPDPEPLTPEELKQMGDHLFGSLDRGKDHPKRSATKKQSTFNPLPAPRRGGGKIERK